MDATPRVWIDWDNDGAFDVADEITEYVETVAVLRGFTDILNRVADVGTVTITLVNHERQFSPLNSSGPYYGNLLPRRPLLIQATDGIETRDILRGVVTRIVPEPDQYGTQRVVIEGMDYLGVLQAATITLPLWSGTKPPEDWIALVTSAAFRAPVASGTITFNDVPSPGDSVTINGRVYALVSSYASSGVVIGATASATASNLAAAINRDLGNGTLYGESETRNEDVTALSEDEVVTITAVARGAWGNGITLTASGADIAVSGATLSGGADGPAGMLDLDSGISAISNAGTQWKSGQTNGLTALRDIAASEFGLIYTAGSGDIVFRNRQYMSQRIIATPDLIVDNDHNIQDGAIDLSRTKNRVTVTYTPLRTLEQGVVAQSEAVIEVPGRGSTDKVGTRWNSTDAFSATALPRKIVTLPFVDTGSGQAVGAQNLVLPLEAGTDYQIEDNSLGTTFGYTYRGYVMFSLAITASGAEVTMLNAATGSLFVYGLQARGELIVAYDPVQTTLDDVDSQDDYGRIEYEYVIPLEIDGAAVFAQALAEYLLGRYKDPVYTITGIGFKGISEVNAYEVWTLDIGDVVRITEEQTDVADKTYMITGVEYQFSNDALTQVTYQVEDLDTETVLILDDATYGLLDSGNVLGL